MAPICIFFFLHSYCISNVIFPTILYIVFLVSINLPLSPKKFSVLTETCDYRIIIREKKLHIFMLLTRILCTMCPGQGFIFSCIIVMYIMLMIDVKIGINLDNLMYNHTLITLNNTHIKREGTAMFTAKFSCKLTKAHLLINTFVSTLPKQTV